jgi:hypothetical protein
VVFDLLAVAGLWFYLAPRDGSGDGSNVQAGLTARVAEDYPGYAVVGVKTLNVPATGATTWYFTIRNLASPGFEYEAVYSAPIQYAGELSAYGNTDTFFMGAASPRQPADSFIRMWLRSHPGQQCFYVFEYTSSSEATRTYDVSYTRYENSGGVVTPIQGTYRYAYSVESDTWAELPEAPRQDASGSFVDTEAVVASMLPAFELVATVADPGGDTLVAQHTKYPGLRVAMYPYRLAGYEPDDGILRLFGGDRTRADAFARAFAARYAGNVIWDITFDPEYTSNENVVDVWFQPGGETARFRYDPKQNLWTIVK